MPDERTAAGNRPFRKEHGRSEARLDRERTIAELTRYLDVAVKARDDFVAVLSHDLKGPLSSISLGAALLLRQLPDEMVGVRRRARMRVPSSLKPVSSQRRSTHTPISCSRSSSSRSCSSWGKINMKA